MHQPSWGYNQTYYKDAKLISFLKVYQYYGQK